MIVISDLVSGSNTDLKQTAVSDLSFSFRKRCRHAHISILMHSACSLTHLAFVVILNLHLDSVMCSAYYVNLSTKAAIRKSICSEKG